MVAAADRHRGDDEGAGAGASASSARANSPAVAYRAPGSLAIARATTASYGASSGATCDGSGTGSLMCANSVAGLRVARERHLPGQRHVEQAAERVDVRARVARAALDPLRRDVVERAREVADLGDRRAAEALVARDRQPEVGHVGVIAGGDEHVAGLDVAVHEPERVRGVERRRDLVEQPRGPRRRERDQRRPGSARRSAASRGTGARRSLPRGRRARRGRGRSPPRAATRAGTAPGTARRPRASAPSPSAPRGARARPRWRRRRRPCRRARSTRSMR